MKRKTREIGSDAEDFAVDYLIERGFEILARNFRSNFCEVDLVAKEGDELVFIEVKACGQDNWDFWRVKLDKRKRGKLITCAKLFCLKNFKSLSKIKGIRFDVIFVDLKRGEINHYEGAFFADDELISF